MDYLLPDDDTMEIMAEEYKRIKKASLLSNGEIKKATIKDEKDLISSSDNCDVKFCADENQNGEENEDSTIPDTSEENGQMANETNVARGNLFKMVIAYIIILRKKF